MRKILLLIAGILAIVAVFNYICLSNCSLCPVRLVTGFLYKLDLMNDGDASGLIKEGMLALKFRKDKNALNIFESILSFDPESVTALWGKAEVLRRSRDLKRSEEIFQKILSKDPEHIPSRLCISYLRFKEDKLDDAARILQNIFKTRPIEKESLAMANLLMGTINGRRCLKGNLFTKLRYGTQIEVYLLRAKSLAADYPEVRLGLGIFYLLAPSIAGGNLEKAISEIEFAVKFAPEFADANAFLAQAYKRKGNTEKYNFYFNRAKKLDPENEALKGF